MKLVFSYHAQNETKGWELGNKGEVSKQDSLLSGSSFDLLVSRKGIKFPLGYSRLRIWLCHYSGSGRCCGAGSISGRKTYTCLAGSQKKKKKKVNLKLKKKKRDKVWVGVSFDPRQLMSKRRDQRFGAVSPSQRLDQSILYILYMTWLRQRRNQVSKVFRSVQGNLNFGHDPKEKKTKNHKTESQLLERVNASYQFCI